MSLVLLLTLVAQADPLVAIVVIDQEARDQGYALQLDGWLIEDALPIDVMEGDKVHLVDADGRKELLDIAAGEAWEITGSNGEAWMSTLGDEIRTDLIAIRGDTAAILDIAASLGVEVLRKGDEVYLKGDAVLFEMPWLEARVSARIDEVRLVRVDDTLQANKPPLSPVVVQPRRPIAVAPKSSSAAPTLVVPAPIALPAPAVTPAKRVPTAQPVVPAIAEPTPAPTAGPVMDRTKELARVRQELMEDYVGLYDCRDNPMFLHAAGVYSFGGEVGTWSVSAPGVVHLLHEDGTLWVKAAIDVEGHHCREVWSKAGPIPAIESSREPRIRAIQSVNNLPL